MSELIITGNTAPFSWYRKGRRYSETAQSCQRRPRSRGTMSGFVRSCHHQ
ncbi:hypothetical protein NECAME_15512 [Necator americanus]|uniref:Uncharacterized protein n=1 Tax=Necator americanus TaxID=51031 RepID=W2SHN5_NECAM|nr:hypothetical protein NECAME_15512 [Necator americanus]ETN69115.1 hypothetical protein NECAME_15512 [Necator americanus]